jgi:3-deoxy-D-manno-octulosonic acid (KDO) 8-phosphate synthase
MSEIIDRVAKAIFEAGMSMHAPQSWEKCNEGQRNNVRRQARAAISELRDILNITNNSSLNYTADELDAELRESS